MYDRKLTTYSELLPKSIATGQTVGEEGAVLVYVEESGVKKVQRSAGASGEVFAGFSSIDNYQPSVAIKIESGIIPETSTYTVSLSHSNIVSGQVRVVDNDTGDAIVYNASVGSGQFGINNTTGVLTFNVAQAGHSITVYYKYNMTVAESVMMYHQRHSNAGASAFLESLGVIGGQGEMWTDQYDISVNYSGITANVTTGANGLVTVGGSGSDIGVVIHAPEASNPMLGIKYTVDNKY